MEIVALGDGECPRGFEEHDRYCYQFRRHRTSWHEATRDCRYRRGHLASVASQLEMTFIRNQTVIRGQNYWIGAYQINRTSGIGLYTDNTPWNNLIQWQINNPGGPPVFACGQILPTGIFKAEVCSRQASSICKRKKPSCGCVNGGTCDDSTESCFCPRGFYGRKCEISQDQLCQKKHHIELNEPFRSTGAEYRRGSRQHCDKNIVYGRWYRFTSPAGAFIPRRCPLLNTCGVQFPVWLDGEMPTVEQGLVRRQACVRTRRGCCGEELSIRIINCTTFPLYYLKATSSCDVGYCAGSEVPCPTGTVSPTGYTPGCIDLRQISVHVIQVFNDTTNQFDLRCHIDPLDEFTGTIVYEVEWWADSSVFLDQAFLEKGKLLHILKEEKLYGQMGRKISCQVSPRLEGATGNQKKIWISSHAVFLGIKVLSASTRRMKECSNGLTIRLQSTVPFLCNIGPRRCNLTLNVMLENAHSDAQNRSCLDGKKIVQAVVPLHEVQCGTILNTNKWNESHSITIIPRRDFQYDGSQDVILRFQSIHMPASQLWHDYRIADKIDVTVDDCDQPTLCSSFSDPHIRTFVGLYYDNFLEGEFIMYRNKKFSIQVNVRFKRCNDYASCTCGMSVQVRDEKFVLDLCKQTPKTLWGSKKVVQIKRIEHHSRCGDVPWLKVTKTKDSKVYKICFRETGGHITVSTQQQSMNVYIFPAMHADLQQTEGLCGALDNFAADSKWLSLVMRNGSLYGQVNQSLLQQPDNFTLEWRAQPDEVIWKAKCVPVQQPLQTYCRCDSDSTTGGASQSSCQKLHDLETCGSCDGDLEIGTSTRTIAKRDIYLQVSLKPGDLKFKQDNKFPSKKSKWPTQSGWTKDKAQSYCERYIAKSPVGKRCATIPGVEVAKAVKICISDIKLSDGTNWADSAVELVQVQCKEALRRSPSLWISAGNKTVLPDEILNTLCPRGCSGNGNCRQGKCVCQAGYEGTDCSLNLSKAPDLYGAESHGLCDVKIRLCDKVIFQGEGFRKSENLTCRMESTMGNNLTGNVYTGRATLQDANTVSCFLPRVPQPEDSLGPQIQHGFRVSISNDGLHYSNGLNVTIYDSECSICQRDGSCTLVQGKCFIRQKCYQAGARHIRDSCRICQPERNQYDWSQISGCPIHSISVTAPSAQVTSRLQIPLRVWLILIIIVLCVILVILIGTFIYLGRRQRGRYSPMKRDKHEMTPADKKIDKSGLSYKA